MFVLNITFKVTWPIYPTWLQWLNSNLLIKMQSLQSAEIKILRLLDVDDEEGPTVAIQFTTETHNGLTLLQEYWEQQGQQLVQQVWGTACIFFATKMQVVQ